MSIKTNIALVKSLIEKACQKNDRDPKDITLVAVSKGHDLLAIKEAYNAGLRHFGESYAQEMSKKIIEAHALGLKDIVWHYLGAVQTNKLNLIASADIIHSLGSVRHAAMLNDMLKSQKKVFLQINLDENPKRQGFSPAQILTAIGKITALPNLKVIGLMCIPPQDGVHSPTFWFQKILNLRNELAAHGSLELKLSMGMSDDFCEAIIEGADYLRIGTKIFGARKN